MEGQKLKCLKHEKLNEIFCVACGNYLCPRCVTDHAVDGHAPKYVHILHYAPKEVLPKIDVLLNDVKSKGKAIEDESQGIFSSLQLVLPKVTDTVKLLEKKTDQLFKIVTKLRTYSIQQFKGSYMQSMMDGLTADKKHLEQALKENNAELALRIALKVEGETQLAKNSESPQDLGKRIQKAVEALEGLKALDDALNTSAMMLTRCQSLKATAGDSNWTCDRHYLSTKMFLSEDNLTYGNTATNGYPAIIGTIPFESGIYAFEVIPTSLECTGKEGFGIIEKEKYLAAHTRDATTPTVYDDMIGFLYSTDAKNMVSERMSAMQMGSKYFVKVDMMECLMTITGPSLKLTAKLKPDMQYYPCFSCGCSSNRIKIRPLVSIEEIEEAIAPAP